MKIIALVMYLFSPPPDSALISTIPLSTGHWLTIEACERDLPAVATAARNHYGDAMFANLKFQCVG